MRRAASLLFGILFSNALLAEPLFSESVLNAWGYETTKVGDKQLIKSIKNLAKSGPAYYARFEIWKECLETPEQAKSQIDKIENERLSTLMGRQKDYQRMIQDSECIYFVRTHAYQTYLDHQPLLMKNIRSYVFSNK